VIERTSESIRVDGDPTLAGAVGDVARELQSIRDVTETAPLGASEDATFLMRRVHDQGGRAVYLLVGTDHPTAHHTPTFDIDERSLDIGVELLTTCVTAVTEDRP